MNCRNCKSIEVEIFHDKVWSIDNGKVYKCNCCELVFIDPMMSEDEEKEFYKNYNDHVKRRGVTVENSVEEFHEKSYKYEVPQREESDNKIINIRVELKAGFERLLSLRKNTGNDLSRLEKFIKSTTIAKIDKAI